VETLRVTDPFQPLFASREERIAHNESWSRSLNERRAEWVSDRQVMQGFRCECWQDDCAERILLSVEDWGTARAEPNRFAVAPDHVAPDIEVVVMKHPHFWLVEKQGVAGDVAEEHARSD
jgi:hypothetical protein